MDASMATSSGFYVEKKFPCLRKLKVSNRKNGTRLVLQRLLCLFDPFFGFCDHASGFGLVGACIVQRTVMCLLLFAQPSNGGCKCCDFLRILLEALLHAEQLEEQAAENKVVLRI